jgi:pilus assembly protein FimV
MRIRQRQLAYDGFDEGILAAAEHEADDSDSAIASAVGAFNAESAVDAIESESDEMDVLAEADVYLAYRRFDKAIELLNGALQNEPERNDYKLKLLEVYAESKDIDGFISQAEQLYAAVGTQGGPVWDKVVKMGRRLTPDHPLFSGTDIPGDVDGDDSATNIDDDGHMAMDFTSNRDTADDEPVAVESDTAIEDGFGDIESLDFTEDDAVSDSLDDDALNFDLGGDSDESGTTTIDDDAEDISSPAKTESEPQGEHQNTAGKGPSNVIDFEAGLLSTPAKAAAHETATPETGDFGNAIDFEAGLSAAEKVVEKDASPATDNVDYSDNVLEFDHGPANDESDVADQATGNDRPADGDVAETEVAAVLQEDETRIDDAQGTDAPGTDDDIDWLSNIDDDLSQDGDAVTDADAVEDLISSGDEVDTKLDLAKAYIDMDDKESARGILDEVVTEGSDDQKREAEQLIQQIG